MNLPIKFPNDADVIAEEAARFRALSPEQRVQTFDEMFELYVFLAERAEQPQVVAEIASYEEEKLQKAVMEFAARHA